ncbi:MAG: glutamyl-tRNA reductase [Melioribacteraceae bacterium]|nr:glutamyl-tRNA reductase [Melioribacteraceae bacterium]
MNLVGITINHNTAGIELREALHLSKDEIIDLIPKLKEFFSEGIVISTCNRTEIFGFPKNFTLAYQEIIDILITHKPVSGITHDNFSKYFSCGAVKHLFSVASGIDSLIIGDSQILGQVKEAFEISEDLGFSGTLMHRVYETAMKVGKRVIKETSIGEGAVSISYAGVQVIEKIFSPLDRKKALVIGAGETGDLAATHLRDKGIGNIAISNRTFERANKLAEKIHGEIIPFLDLNEHLHNFDIIISATSSPDLILTKNDIKKMMNKRRGETVVIMDIALPRDIDSDVRHIENVFYHDIDSLKVIVDQNVTKRKNEIPKAIEIIMEEMHHFFGWVNTLEVVPVIKSVRDFFEEIRLDELEKLKNKVSEEDFTKFEDMTRRMMGRILHNPTIKLRQLAESGTNIQDTLTHSILVRDLFDLDKKRKNGEE